MVVITFADVIVDAVLHKAIDMVFSDLEIKISRIWSPIFGKVIWKCDCLPSLCILIYIYSLIMRALINDSRLCYISGNS